MRPLASSSVAMLTVLFIAMTLALRASADTGYTGQWFTARATRYGGPDDPWSINQGNCGYGYLDPNRATGLNVAALADADSDFSNSCGRCYEVACQNMALTDGYGQHLDRSSVCYDASASIVIQITDSCPCNYPSNAYSNKRWCCGDMYHMDLSQWVFEKLADPKWGVIGLKARQVPCDHQPSNPAKAISHPTPASAAPSGWSPSKDKRPWV